MPDFYVPEVIEDLTSKQVLTTELIEGTSLDKIENPDQDTINKVLQTKLTNHPCFLRRCLKLLHGACLSFQCRNSWTLNTC